LNVCKGDESRITASEMKFVRRKAGCIGMDYKRNFDLMKELNTQPIMEIMENWRSNWRNYFLRKPLSRIPF
jgi:argininosuccinate synthase